MNPKLSVMTEGAQDNMAHWSKLVSDTSNRNERSDNDPIWSQTNWWLSSAARKVNLNYSWMNATF